MALNTEPFQFIFEFLIWNNKLWSPACPSQASGVIISPTQRAGGNVTFCVLSVKCKWDGRCSPVEVDGADGKAAAEHVHHLHGQVQAAGRLVEANAEVCRTWSRETHSEFTGWALVTLWGENKTELTVFTVHLFMLSDLNGHFRVYFVFSLFFHIYAIMCILTCFISTLYWMLCFHPALRSPRFLQ